MTKTCWRVRVKEKTLYCLALLMFVQHCQPAFRYNRNFTILAVSHLVLATRTEQRAQNKKGCKLLMMLHLCFCGL